MTVPEWTWDLSITVPLAFTLLVFALGVLQLSPRVRRGARALERRILLFCAGWVVLAGALVSPLHQLGERSLAPICWSMSC
jgi:cytochrome c oxidase assembly factor CtaG